MFQPEVKLEFVRRYCSPRDGWTVFVDIDASEEGRTGGERRTEKARRQQKEMQEAGCRMRKSLKDLGATVGGDRVRWFDQNRFPRINGDRDIVALNFERRVCLIVEVEGNSTGQPEQKLYKAIGQLVMAASLPDNDGWHRVLVLAVHGNEIARHLKRATALEKLGISALALERSESHDQWLVGGQLELSGPGIFQRTKPSTATVKAL